MDDEVLKQILKVLRSIDKKLEVQNDILDFGLLNIIAELAKDPEVHSVTGNVVYTGYPEKAEVKP